MEGSRREQAGQQTILGPAEFVGFEDTIAIAVEVVKRVGKGYLLHLVHVGTNDGTIHEFHDHRGGLLGHKRMASQKGNSQKE